MVLGILQIRFEVLLVAVEIAELRAGAVGVLSGAIDDTLLHLQFSDEQLGGFGDPHVFVNGADFGGGCRAGFGYRHSRIARGLRG